jgi:hypothetical protein
MAIPDNVPMFTGVTPWPNVQAALNAIQTVRTC